MSPERRRNDRILARALIGMALAVGVLVAGVAILAGDVKSSERQAREQQTLQLRGGCARGVARDFESMAANRATARMARALGYDRTAVEAEARADRIGARIPGDENLATVAAFCAGLYPSR